MATGEKIIEYQDNFETGNADRWDVAESDDSSQLDFPHYTELARRKDMPMPYSGAYLARWILSGSTDVATIGEGDIDIANGETKWFRMRIWVSSSFLADSTVNDVIPLLELQRTTGNAVQYAFGIRTRPGDTPTRVNYGVGVLAPTAWATNKDIELDTWYTIELKVNVQTAAATGEIELYITKDGDEPSSTADASVATNQSDNDVVRGILGTQGVEDTTFGTICINDFKMQQDDRIWPEKDRFSTVMTTTQNGHLFVGAGRVSNVALIQGGSNDNNILRIYDSDNGGTQGLKLQVASSSTSESQVQDSSGVPFDVTRGCFAYIEGAGAAPDYAAASAPITAVVTIDRAPNWFSDGNIRRFALRRNITG